MTKQFTLPDGREDNRTAKISAFLENIPGGVHLERDLHGCRYWNTADLKRVPVKAISQQEAA